MESNGPIETVFSEFDAKCDEIKSYIMGESQKQTIYHVEKGMLSLIMSFGLICLQAFLQVKGDGAVGPTHTDQDGIIRPRHSNNHDRGYFSIFGKLVINRAYYWAKDLGGVCPLDACLNLPKKSYSYLLESWALKLGVHGSYQKVIDIFYSMLGITLCKDPVERMMADASQSAPEFYEGLAVPESGSEGEILVETVDGKGVPLTATETKKQGHRLKKGEKKTKKKVSTVSAVYTIDRHIRTVDDVVKEVLEADRAVKSGSTPEGVESRPDRPKPKNKVVKATLEGKQAAFEDLNRQAEARDPGHKKDRVALVDGEPALRKLIKNMLTGFCIILDLFHVLEYIWKAAYVFHKEGSPEAEAYVRRQLRQLLMGNVNQVIAELETDLKTKKLSIKKKDKLKKVIGYLTRGKNYMQYDVYLAKGYPIGSGVVEGACRNLVKDRMELTGMHWTVDGAEAVLQMRSVEVNGMWQEFWDSRMAAMQIKLYPYHVADYPAKELEIQAMAA